MPNAVNYDYINQIEGSVSPSTVHCKNAFMERYFRRYLLQKAMSVFKWSLPEHWSKDYFLYSLFGFGYVAVFATDKFGVIPQSCGLKGYDVFYRPTHAVISNPLMRGILEPAIGKQCTIIKLQPDYGGIMDLVSYYADMLALCAEAVAVNLVNSKGALIFGATTNTQAESFKKAFDKVSSGEPAVYLDKSLLNAEGQPTWFPFVQDIGSNYIVSDVLSDMRKIEAMFATDIGIPNANTDKKERLISDEVNANNVETSTRCELWLESLQESCKKTREMFGIEISVDWRVKPDTMREGGSEDGKSNPVPDGSL